MSATAILTVLGPVLLKSGAGILSRIVKNKFGEGPAKIVDLIAGQLNVEATPEAIVQKYEQSPHEVSAVIKAVEEDNMDQWALMFAAERDIIEIQHDTIRQEIAAKGLLTRIWRPFVGFMFGVNSTAVVGTVCLLALLGRDATILVMADVWPLITAVLTAMGSVTGYYVHSRTKEKITNATS